MSSPWKKITITPVDISVKTHLTDDIQAQISGGYAAHPLSQAIFQE